MPTPLCLSDTAFLSNDRQELLDIMPQFLILLSRALKERFGVDQDINKTTLLNTWSATRKSGVWYVQSSASSKVRRFSGIVRDAKPTLFNEASSYLSGQFTQGGLSSDLVFSMMSIAKSGKYPALLQQGGVILKCFILLAEIIVSETVVHKTSLIASPLGIFWFGHKKEKESPFGFDDSGHLQWSPQFDLEKIKVD